MFYYAPELILFYTIFGVLIAFIASLISFCHAKSKNKKNPGTYSDTQIKTRKNLLIASSIIAGIILAVLIGNFVLLMFAIAHM